MAKEIKKEETAQEEVNEALSTAGKWIIDNQNVLIWSVTAIIVVIFGIMALNTYVLQPRAQEANNENAKAVVYFMQGEWKTALEGDEADCEGFEAIAHKYSRYQAGELAALYAGICEYKLGDYEMAAQYLKKFNANDLNIDPAAKMLLGDAYVELDELSKAVNAFKEAAESKNELIAPMALKKAGLVLLEQNKKAEAKRAFETIKNEYSQSAEAQDIEKYVAFAEAE